MKGLILGFSSPLCIFWSSQDQVNPISHLQNEKNYLGSLQSTFWCHSMKQVCLKLFAPTFSSQFHSFYYVSQTPYYPFLFPSSFHEHFWSLHTFMSKTFWSFHTKLMFLSCFHIKFLLPHTLALPSCLHEKNISLNTFTPHTHGLMLVNFENKHNFELGISFEHWGFHMKMKTQDQTWSLSDGTYHHKSKYQKLILERNVTWQEYQY